MSQSDHIKRLVLYFGILKNPPFSSKLKKKFPIEEEEKILLNIKKMIDERLEQIEIEKQNNKNE